MRGPFAFHATRDQLPRRRAVFTAPYLWSLSLYKTPSVFEFSIFMNDTIFLLMVVISELYVTTDPPPLTLYN